MPLALISSVRDGQAHTSKLYTCHHGHVSGTPTPGPKRTSICSGTPDPSVSPMPSAAPHPPSSSDRKSGRRPSDFSTYNCRLHLSHVSDSLTSLHLHHLNPSCHHRLSPGLRQPPPNCTPGSSLAFFSRFPHGIQHHLFKNSIPLLKSHRSQCSCNKKQRPPTWPIRPCMVSLCLTLLDDATHCSLNPSLPWPSLLSLNLPCSLSC